MKKPHYSYYKFSIRFLKNSFYLAIILSLFVGLSACEEDKDEQDLCTPTFQADLFEDNLEATLDGNVMGYSFIVTRNGNVIRSGANGKAQNGADGNINMSLYKEMQVASISKFITSMTAIHVCRLKNVSLNTKIGPYLPSRWQRGAGINDVTIAELITQTPGMNQVGTQSFSATRFDSLRMYVAAGATLSKTRRYSNTHCGLLRVILPRLWDKYRDNTGNYNAEWFENNYKTTVRELMFDQIDIDGDMMPKNGSQILAYTGGNDNGPGSGATTDFSPVSGGTGWNLTTFDVAKFFAYTFYSSDYINDNDKEWAKTNRAGLWNTILNGEHGPYYCKLGGWNFTSGNPAKAMNSCIMLFPDGIQITVFINSPAPGGSLRTVVQDAYDDAYGC
jgi:hypothetical protein